MNDFLKEKLRAVPKQPGCYLFKDSMGNVIYVGKAKSLSSRVRSYFSAAAKKDERIQGLIRQIEDVEYHVTPTETDALLQEYRLIKALKPWFNSQLKRDTPHPFMRIDTESEYPSISIVDETSDDNAEYIGSFFDVFDAQETIELLNLIWKTPLCKQSPLPAKACLFASIGRCVAPCKAEIDSETYQATIAEIVSLLRGKQCAMRDRLEHELAHHIRELEFEKAALLSKKLAALDKLQRKGRKLVYLPKDQDAVMLLRAYHAKECMLFYMCRGVVVNMTCLTADMSEIARGHEIEMCFQSDNGTAIESWLNVGIFEILADKRFFRIEEATFSVVIDWAQAQMTEMFAD